MACLLGKEELPVVMAEEPLARIIVKDAHEEDHRCDIQDVLARTRKLMWIPRGRCLARKVIRDCILCRRKNATLQRQMMAQLPEDKVSKAAPFQYTALDMFGPLTVKDPTKGHRLSSAMAYSTYV